MSRFSSRFATLAAASFLLAAVSFARQPLEPSSANPTGKYTLAGGGYVVLSVDDLGHVEGFFERNGAFGRLSGRSVAGVVSATWVQTSGSSACETSVADFEHWGRVTLTRTNSGGLDTAWSHCDSAPTALETAR